MGFEAHFFFLWFAIPTVFCGSANRNPLLFQESIFQMNKCIRKKCSRSILQMNFFFLLMSTFIQFSWCKLRNHYRKKLRQLQKKTSEQIKLSIILVKLCRWECVWRQKVVQPVCTVLIWNSSAESDASTVLRILYHFFLWCLQVFKKNIFHNSLDKMKFIGSERNKKKSTKCWWCVWKHS